MDAKLLAAVRRIQRPDYGGEMALQQVQMNNGGELLVAAALPPHATVTLRGDSWVAKTAARAPVTAIPTTAYLLNLYNGEALGGKSYIIDSVFLMQVAVTAAIQNVGILYNVSYKPSSLVAPAGGVTPIGLFGGKQYGGKGLITDNSTLDATNGIAPNWFPAGLSPSAQNTLQIGTSVDWDCGGRIIIPPGGSFSVTGLAGAATATSIQMGFRWHEILLPYS